MNSRGKTVTLFTILHFFVDFTTVFLISRVLLGYNTAISDRGSVVIVYNLIAFAGQLPVGIFSDMLGKNYVVAAIGCALAAISYPLAPDFPWAACFVTALGNGAFHVGAGSEVLKISMPKAAMSGVFVSSGALGVWLAYKASGNVFMWGLPLIMAVAVLVLVLWKKDEVCDKNIVLKFGKPDILVLVAVSCFLFTVVIRSMLGMMMNFPWKTVPLWSFLFTVAVVLGKAVGGFIGDRFGYLKTAVISLAVSLICFIPGFDEPVIGIIAVLCFNMTMPLTLSAVAGESGNKYGFAFGLTTFALAIGFIAIPFGISKLFGYVFITACVAFSILMMTAGYILLKKLKR